MVKIEGSLEEIHALLGAGGKTRAKSASKRSTTATAPSKPKKKKLSAYNQFMKKELPKLRKKHPRMKQGQLMKKAAAMWRKKKK